LKNNNKSVVYHCEEKITGNPHNDRKLQSNITHQPMTPKTNIKHEIAKFKHRKDSIAKYRNYSIYLMQLDFVFKKAMVKPVIYMLFSYQTGYIM
jgi:hypothetical protein